MRRYSQRNGLTTLAELNITPLLDLAFVLLIIFIITTPLMENSLDVVVPSSRAAQSAVDPAAVQTVEIGVDDRMALNGQPTTLAELEVELTALREAQPEVAVVVRSDRTLPVQNLVDVMDVLKRARITKVGVLTTPAEP
jgi:biopolymer transport protein ExbD